MDELLLYLRLEDFVVLDDTSARGIGVADARTLLAAMREAVEHGLVERWASGDEPIDLTAPFEALADRAIGARLTEKGRDRVNVLLERAHETGDEELDEATRRALDLPRVEYATVMSDLAKS